MAEAYYSTVFEQPADTVWNTIRDFNNYPVWVDGAGESRIEDGKSGDTVGAVRDVVYQGNRIRQRLLALSDAGRSQSYEFAEKPPAYLQHLDAFRVTITVRPIVDGERAFVEWSAAFDCDAQRRRETADVLRNAFAKWLGSLRRKLAVGE